MSLCTRGCHIQLEAHSTVSAFNLLRINTHAYTQICKLVLPMGSYNLIEYIVIAFPYHLLCSSGASYPFVCHLEWCSVYFSFISHQHPPPLPRSPSSTLLFFSFLLTCHPTGRPRRPFNSPETVDVLPQDSVDLFSSRVWFPLQHAAQRVRSAWPNAAGHAFLRHLWPWVVSANLYVAKMADRQGLWGCKCKWVRWRWKAAIDALRQSKTTWRDRMKDRRNFFIQAVWKEADCRSLTAV